MRRSLILGAWLGVTGATTAYLAASFFGGDRELFLPGPTTHGHYQIESKCEVCHTELGGVEQEACLKCHEEELAAVDDSHPASKFLDPRNAGFIAKLDARRCVACHVEHRPEMTHAMGVTEPRDFCVYCHAEIAEERPSHQGMAFDTCDAAGCHNYHDNLALSEDFLRRHLDEPKKLSVPVVVVRTADNTPATPLTKSQNNAPRSVTDKTDSRELIDEWERTAHARSGVNCGDCHGVGGPGGERRWSDAVDLEVCARCHGQEHKGFLEGRHGMRLAQGLSPMRPELARLPMHDAASGRELVCTRCHGAHAFDTKRAAVDACLECHADEHSKAYLESPHRKKWEEEQAGASGEGTGVSCATCHMPRLEVRSGGDTRILVDHNQNNSLRPNEKMIRTVCHKCHGLQFSINSLADPALIRSNFQGESSTDVETFKMVKPEQN